MTDLKIVGDAEQFRWDEPLWRYFRPKRFMDAIETASLYFAAPQQFQDPFEGAAAVMPFDFPIDPRYAEYEDFEEIFAGFRHLIKINCWHRSDYESNAMWQLYANASKGVAIRSTPSRMRAALEPFRVKPEHGEEQLFCGNVKYVDMLTGRLKEITLSRFFHKHRVFEWEREFRLAVDLHTADEFTYGVVPRDGIAVNVNIAELVESVYLGPKLSWEDRDGILQVCERLHIKTVVTSMLGRPRFI